MLFQLVTALVPIKNTDRGRNQMPTAIRPLSVKLVPPSKPQGRYRELAVGRAVLLTAHDVSNRIRTWHLQIWGVNPTENT